MNNQTPTLLEERIAAAGDPDKLPTAEERELAALNSSALYKDKLGEAGAAIDPQLALKRQLGRYHSLTRPKMSATKVYKCRGLLEQGEDPFMLAIYFNADFTAVANIANDILRVRAEAKGQDKFQTIPITVHGYLKAAQDIENRKAQAARVLDMTTLQKIEIHLDVKDKLTGIVAEVHDDYEAFFWPKSSDASSTVAQYEAEVSVPDALKHFCAGLVNSLDHLAKQTQTKDQT